MWIFILFIFLIILVYIGFLTWLLLSPEKENIKAKENFEPGVSVVIPFRNEEEKLARLLKSLSEQDFPKDKVEWVLIDDHSYDKGPEIIKKWRSIYSEGKINFISMKEQEGKKAALYEGVRQASYSIILQTDADCFMHKNWISSSVKPFVNDQIKASAGMVKMKSSDKNFLSRFFALEFMSLQAAGMLLMKRGLPVMANGANLAYRKDSWLEYHPETDKWASGDDVFFIQQLARQNLSGIVFNKESQTMTDTPSSLRRFLNQRIRWGSKTPSYPLKKAKYIAYVVAAQNICLWVLGSLVFLDIFNIVYLFIALFLKSVPEYLILSKFAKKTDQKSLLKIFPLATVLYPVYIMAAGIAIIFAPSKVKWKGRPIRV